MKDLLMKYEKATVEEQAKIYSELAQKYTDLQTQSDVTAKELASVKESVTVKDTEIASLKVTIETLTKDCEAAKAEIKRRDDEIKAKLVSDRRGELAELAKDVSDEDILNDLKFENLKLKKENASLKSASVKPAEVPVDLDKGSKKGTIIADIVTRAKRVQDLAWGKNALPEETE